MGELGNDARYYHQAVGDYVKELAIDQLLSLGVLSQSASDVFTEQSIQKGKHFSERLALANYLFHTIEQHIDNGLEDIAILVKGSRSAHMELVVTDIMNWFNDGNRESTRFSSNQNIKGVS